MVAKNSRNIACRKCLRATWPRIATLGAETALCGVVGRRVAMDTPKRTAWPSNISDPRCLEGGWATKRPRTRKAAPAHSRGGVFAEPVALLRDAICPLARSVLGGLNRRDSLRNICATSRGGNAGHFFIAPVPQIPESARLVVLPRYNCFDNCFDHLPMLRPTSASIAQRSPTASVPREFAQDAHFRSRSVDGFAGKASVPN